MCGGTSENLGLLTAKLEESKDTYVVESVVVVVNCMS